MDKKPLILLVDDEPDILELYKMKLEAAGMEIITSTNGAEGIHIAAEKNPDLVIMDIKMPVMNGVEAFIKLKENPATKNIKVVFFTAFADLDKSDVDVKYAKDIGAADFLRKGMDLNEFVSEIKKHLGVS